MTLYIAIQNNTPNNRMHMDKFKLLHCVTQLKLSSDAGRYNQKEDGASFS